MLKLKLLSSKLLLILIILLLSAVPATAAVLGFVAESDDGKLYEYSYKDLIDSYALSILGSSDGFYEDFAARRTYALLSSTGKYLDYKEALDRYASALINNEDFDLKNYIEADEVKIAEMPQTIKAVKLNSGKIVYDTKKIDAGEAEDGTNQGSQRTKTPIVGAAEVSLKQAQEWAASRDAHQRFIDIAKIYWELAEDTGLRPEVLYAQAAMETLFGKYTGNVPPDYNNWAGIKIADADGDRRENHEAFDTPEEGVIAHYNHLSAYAGLEPIGNPHGRYFVVKEQSWAGSVLYLEDLSGKWTPQDDYHVYILIAINQMLDIEVEEQKEEETDGEGSAPDDDNPGSENESSGNDDIEQNEGESASESDSPGSEDEDEDTLHVAVDVSILRLRGGPSTDHDILDRLSLGTVLRVTGSDGEWLKVITPQGKNGWVHGDYVKIIEMNVSGSTLKGKKIMIDPGHGGSDPGAIGVTGLREKDVNLAVSETLVTLLRNAGADVIVTRSGDQSVSHQKRVEMANAAKADIYVSIHANSYSRNDSNGTETHYCSNSGNSSASRFLAHQLQRELVSYLGLRDRGVKSNSFYVLKNAQMPSALVELAFLSNPDEEELLRQPEAHNSAAQALYEGIEAYFLYYR